MQAPSSCQRKPGWPEPTRQQARCKEARVSVRDGLLDSNGSTILAEGLPGSEWLGVACLPGLAGLTYSNGQAVFYRLDLGGRVVVDVCHADRVEAVGLEAVGNTLRASCYLRDTNGRQVIRYLNAAL